MSKSTLVKLFFSVLALSPSFVQASLVGGQDAPLRLVAIDACFLPKGIDFLKNKHIEVEFITSASPVLGKIFNSQICSIHYDQAVGPGGKVVAFHSHFMGAKMEDLSSFNQVLTRLTAKHGKVDLVLSNNSDLAIIMGNFARKHLGIAPARWEIDSPECFYDKLIMKLAVTQDSAVKTAEFIEFDAPQVAVDQFVEKTPFPLILKKRRSAGSVGIQVIASKAEFAQLYSKTKHKENYIVERFVSGQSLRIDGEKIEGKIALLIPSFMRTSPLEYFQGGKSANHYYPRRERNSSQCDSGFF